MSSLSLERYRRQLEIAMGKRPRRPLTGIEKHWLEEEDHGIHSATTANADA